MILRAALRSFTSDRCWRKPHLLWLAGGLAALAAHALSDFPLQNLAVLLTATRFLTLLDRWAALENAAGHDP